MNTDEKPTAVLFRAIENKDNNQVTQLLTEHPGLVNVRYDYVDDSDVLFGKVTPLHVAVYKDNVDVVKLLLSLKAKPNRKTIWYSDKDATPLHFARSAMVAELLIKSDALVNKKDECGRTPLYVALFHPWRSPIFKVAECLVLYGAKANQIGDSLGNTLLHIAIREYGSVMDRVTFLLRSGADRTLRNNAGETPLDYAIRYHNGWWDLIDLLR